MNESQLLNYLEKNKFPSSNHFAMADTAIVWKLAENNNRVTDIVIYDKNGKLIIPHDTLVFDCDTNIKAFLKNVDSTRYLNVDQNNFFESIYYQNLLQLNGQKAPSKLKEGANYYVVIYWASFMGNYSKHLLEYEHEIKPLRNDIEFIKINMDLREFSKINYN